MTEKQDITWFWEEMESGVRQSLSEQQRAAIEDAVRKSPSQTQPADVRLHLGAYFIRVIAGRERRNPERLRQDRKDYPVFVRRNATVIAVFGMLLLFSTLYVLASMTTLVVRLIFV